MPRPLSNAASLTKFLDAVEQPIYGVDDERRLTFANRACVEWTGVAAQDLIGVIGHYHSPLSAGAAENWASRLCPPPEAFTGQAVDGWIVWSDSAGNLFRRRARYLPLGSGDGAGQGVLVLVDAQTHAGDTPPDDERDALQPAAETMHQIVAQVRARQRARYHPDQLVGRAPAIERARRQLAIAQTTAGPLLVVGPAGSGRRHVAETFHHGGSRGEGTLLPLACDVLGTELLESTLAAVSASTSEVTLLLSEVDQLPAEVQSSLARLMSRLARVRIVATSRQRLTDLAAKGGFDARLAQQLSVLVIELPALTERREDLPLLAQLFLEEANAQSEKQLSGWTSEALDLLTMYDWPGGLDELAVVAGEAHAQAEGMQITFTDLPGRIRQSLDAKRWRRPVDQPIELDDVLMRVERTLIRQALATARGNKTRAAALLGVTRPRLYRRVVELGLEPSSIFRPSESATDGEAPEEHEATAGDAANNPES